MDTRSTRFSLFPLCVCLLPLCRRILVVRIPRSLVIVVVASPRVFVALPVYACIRESRRAPPA